MQEEEVERLEEIRDEISELINEALSLIPHDSIEHARAKAYWYASVVTSLSEDHEFCGSSMCSLQSTIDSLREVEATEH